MNPETRIENRLVKRIKEALPGCFIWKVQQKSLRGAADRNVLFRGLFSALEVKNGDAKPTSNQLYWLARVEEAGGFSRVVNERNIEEVVEEIQGLNSCSLCGRPLPGKKQNFRGKING